MNRMLDMLQSKIQSKSKLLTNDYIFLSIKRRYKRESFVKYVVMHFIFDDVIFM